MTALGRWVEQGGGGLLVAGGESVFGEKGYRKTEIERLTPVTFERRDEPELALVLVLDRLVEHGGHVDGAVQDGGAGGGRRHDRRAGGRRPDVQRSVRLERAAARTSAQNRANIREKIAAIEPGGETLIFPALEQAYLALRTAKARVKHVVLLSDGRSYPDDYEALVRR